MNVNGKLLDEWNLANTKARLDYHRQEGLVGLPGSLNHRTAGIHGWPTRGWLLDALAECELAEARAAIAECMANAAVKELAEAMMRIKELEREDSGTEVRGMRQEDRDDGVQEHRGMFWGLRGKTT